jgi:H+/Cl- antiporter ClcA
MEAYARTRQYWVRFGWGLLVGVLGAIGTLIFVTIMNWGTALLWPADPPSGELFSGSWQIVAIMTAAGLIVGLLHHFILAKEIMFAGAIVEGRLDPRPVPGGLLVSMVSLVGGFSLGPEVPCGMLAGGLATWLSKRRKLDEETERINVLSSIMGAYGGLFTTPFAFLLMPLELQHRQRPRYYGTLIIAGSAAILGFALFFALSGDRFSDLLGFLDLPDFDLKVWHLGIAVLLGILGAILTVIYGLLTRGLKQLAAPLESQPIIRSTLAGLLLGLLGVALPLTLFLGSGGLVTVTEDAATLGTGLLILYVFAKMLAMAGAMATGFIGGPIFPLFFVGGTAGTAINLIFPDIPMALAVSCVMAAVPAALLPVPISMGILVLLVAGIPSAEAIPVFVAALAAFFVTHGFGLLPPPEESQKHEGSDAAPSGEGAPSKTSGAADASA